MLPSAAATLGPKLSRLRAIAAGPDSKGPARIARELLALRAQGESPRYYLSRLLHLRNAAPVTDFLSTAETEALWAAKRRPEGYVRVYQDKTLFDEHYRRPVRGEPPFPMPAYLGQTRASILLRPDREDISLHDAPAFARALSEMVAASPTGRVFAKPVVGNKGTGAMLVRSDHSTDKAERVRQAASEVDYLFQEAVDQHAEMDQLHPGCLNTLRIITGMARDGSLPVFSVALRIGQGSKPVDNTHAGGLVAGVDRDTGRLRDHVQTMYHFGGRTLSRHPETDVPFGDFVVPHFADAVELSRRAHARLPLLYAGWDVGITPDGPVLIEGNPGPYLLMMELANGGFKADPVARAFLAEQGVVAEAD